MQSEFVWTACPDFARLIYCSQVSDNVFHCLADYVGRILIVSSFVFRPRFFSSLRPVSFLCGQYFLLSLTGSNNRILSWVGLSAPTSHASAIVTQVSDDVFYCLAD